MDIRTIMICLIFVNAFLGFFMFITMKAHKVYPGYNLWAFSTSFVFVVYILLALRGRIPDFLSIVVSNSIVGIVCSMRVSALRRFFNMPRLKYLWVLPLTVFILFCYYFVYDNVAARLTVITTFMVLVCFYIAYLFFVNGNNGSRLLYATFIIVCFGVSFLLIFRWKSLFFTNSGMNMIPTNANVLFYLFSIVADIFWATLFYAMNSYRLSMDLENANLKLAESNAVKNKFFTIVSHDLRGPVGNISRYLNQIINNNSLYDEDKKVSVLNQLSYTADKTYSLLDELLVWAQIQSGGILVKNENIEMNNFINEVIPIFTQMASYKHIRLNIDVPDNIVVISDKNMLRSVLLNLITNAIKFSNEGGVVNISARREGDHIKVMVADNGTGFSQDYLSSITNHENMLTKNGTWDETGTGFGLIICDEFLQHLGSEMRIESIEGEGSEFSFTLKSASPLRI